MKTVLKRWWQLAVPIGVVAAFVALTSTTQTGCGGSSCPTISGTWNLIETITTSTCSGDYPGKMYVTNGLIVSQNSCNVTFPTASGLTGKLDGSNLTLTGSFSYFGGVYTLTSAKATVASDGKGFTGTWTWTWTGTGGSCNGTSSIVGTKTG